MTLLRCLTCGVDVDPNGLGYANHALHELAPPLAPEPPKLTTAEITEHLRIVRHHIETMSRVNGGVVDGRDKMLADILEFLLKLEKDIQEIRMQGMHL